jgi:hypothetical protein
MICLPLIAGSSTRWRHSEPVKNECEVLTAVESVAIWVVHIAAGLASQRF